MPEFQPNPALHNLQQPQRTAETESALDTIRLLDPELLQSPEPRVLVGIGVQLGAEVTERFGTPEAPKWASGTHEQEVMMSYHNGEGGHSGMDGAGVPRNVLLIAKAVNHAASERAGEPVEVYSPVDRATALCAAFGHDGEQLCGRALLPEGQQNQERPDERRGDELLSAEAVRGRILEAGVRPEVAEQGYDDVMATAFNPQTGAQNVDYETWRANPGDPDLTRVVLGQELTAAADLLGPTSPRGPLGAVEYSVESLCLVQKNQVVQERLRARGIDLASVTRTDQLLDIIGEDEVLRGAFADTVAGQSKFFSDFLKYSDEAIRKACGKGIDELFPGRVENAGILAQFADRLRAGESPRAIWQSARELAGR